MICALLDTNIPVSALPVRAGNEAAVAKAVGGRQLQPCLGTATVQEHGLVLHRPKLRFPADTTFIACALAAQARHLVTGNRRHFPGPRYGATEAVNAREPLARLPAA